MARVKPPVTAEYVRERLEYDPETGVFRWKARPGTDRITVAWNARYAGTVAGSLDADGYRSIDLDKRHFRAARLAWAWMTGEFPPALVDHRNLDPADDRWSNLRPATHGQNMANTRARAPSGLKGAYSYPRLRGKWVAMIGAGKQRRHLGTFATAEEAHAAYRAAAAERYGDFARVD